MSRVDPLFDLTTFDLERVIEEGSALDRYLPQHGLMRHVDALVAFDRERELAIGLKRVRADEFWCAGHFPGFPVLPGVIMLEAMAQLCTVFWRQCFDPAGRMMMFGGLEEVRFRDIVRPPSKLYLLLKAKYLRMKLSRFDCQAVCDGKVACEAQIIGVLGPAATAGGPAGP